MPPALRKRARELNYAEDQENIPPADAEPAAPKRAKPSPSTRKAPPKKTPAARPAASKSAEKQAAKLYKTTLADIDKEYKRLERGYKLNSGDNLNRFLKRGITSDKVTRSMLRFLPKVEELLKMGVEAQGPRHAFNLLMYVGEHAHADLDFGPKMCGCGDMKGPYGRMDDLMVRVIEERWGMEGQRQGRQRDHTTGEGEQETAREASPNEHEAFLRSLGDKRPNKSERKMILNLRRKEKRKGIEKRRIKRETEPDWVSNSLKELAAKQAYLDGYGMGEHFFTKSILKLRELEAAPLAEPAARTADQ